MVETYLKEWNGSVLIVSHDRYFSTRWLPYYGNDPSLEIYHGNYTAYLTQRMERYPVAWKNTRPSKPLLKKKEYIRRNIAGQIRARLREGESDWKVIS